MATLIIDATNSVVGRLAAFTAKTAIKGDTVEVYNSQKAFSPASSQLVRGLPKAPNAAKQGESRSLSSLAAKTRFFLKESNSRNAPKARAKREGSGGEDYRSWRTPAGKRR